MVPTQVDVGGPEARATLEADGALRHDGRVAVGPHQVVDLEQDLRPRKLQSACKVTGKTAGPPAVVPNTFMACDRFLGRRS